MYSKKIIAFFLCVSGVCATEAAQQHLKSDDVRERNLSQTSKVQAYDSLMQAADCGDYDAQHQLLEIAVKCSSWPLLKMRRSQSCIHPDVAAIAEARFFLNAGFTINYIHEHYEFLLLPSKMSEIQIAGNKEAAFGLYQLFLLIKKPNFAQFMLKVAAQKGHLEAQHLLLADNTGKNAL